MMDLSLVVAVLAGLAILVFFIGFSRSLDTSKIDRLEEYLSDPRASSLTTASSSNKVTISPTDMVQGLDKVLRSVALGDRLARDLRNADLQMTVLEYLFVWLLLIAGSTAIGYIGSHSWLPAAFTGLFGALLPFIVLRYRQNKRLQAFERQLPNVLMQLAGSMRAGYGLLQAVDFVAHEMPPPAGREFAQVARDVKLGRTTMEALDDLVERIDSPDLQLIVTAIRIHAETGGNLAEILDTVGETIRERVRIRGELRVLTSQQRLAGYVLAVLPIGLFLLLMLLNPSFEMRLFTPGWTLCVPLGAIVFMILGFVITRRIVNIKV